MQDFCLQLSKILIHIPQDILSIFLEKYEIFPFTFQLMQLQKDIKML